MFGLFQLTNSGCGSYFLYHPGYLYNFPKESTLLFNYHHQVWNLQLFQKFSARIFQDI